MNHYVEAQEAKIKQFCQIIREKTIKLLLLLYVQVRSSANDCSQRQKTQHPTKRLGTSTYVRGARDMTGQSDSALLAAVFVVAARIVGITSAQQYYEFIPQESFLQSLYKVLVR